MSQKAELVIAALQQRMGELVSNYETQIAVLRAELTELMQEKQNREREGLEKDEAAETYSQRLDDITTN